MVHYALKSAIPVESSSTGFFYNNNKLYFASNTFVYSYTEGLYDIQSTLQSDIKQIIVKEGVIYTITADSLVLTNEKFNFASLSRKSNYMSISNKYIALAVCNTLEIWFIPTEYKFGMFTLKLKNNRHVGNITCLKFLDETRVISGGQDCSVRLLDLETNESRKLLSTSSTPIRILILSNHIIVVCEEGQLYYLNSDTLQIEKKIYKNNRISCACNFKDVICISLWDKLNTKIEIIIEKEVVYSFEIAKQITELFLDNFVIGLKSKTWISLFDYEKDSYKFSLDLVKISCMNFHNDNIVVGCSDKKIRIYDDNRLVKTLCDDKNTNPIYKVHFLKKSVMSVSINGYISIFDLLNETCFRSFNIPLKISCTEVCDDGMIFFMADADTYQIRVIDLQRSKEADILDGHEAPIKKMQYKNGFLFSLSYDNIFKKWDIYKQECQTLEIDKTALAFLVQNSKIYILLQNEISIYNFDFEYVSMIGFNLKKQQDEFAISFNGKYAFLGGQNNRISVFNTEFNTIDQTIKVSRNKNWANYKDVYFNKNISTDKKNIIEVLFMKHSPSQNKLYLMSREGVFIYDMPQTRYLPLSLDIETTTEAINKYLQHSLWLNAFIAILKVEDIEYFMKLVNLVPDDIIEGLIQNTLHNSLNLLRHFISSLLSRQYNIYKLYQWNRYLVFYFGQGVTEHQVSLVSGKEAYDLTLENIYMLENLIN